MKITSSTAPTCGRATTGPNTFIGFASVTAACGFGALAVAAPSLFRLLLKEPVTKAERGVCALHHQGAVQRIPLLKKKITRTFHAHIIQTQVSYYMFQFAASLGIAISYLIMKKIKGK